MRRRTRWSALAAVGVVALATLALTAGGDEAEAIKVAAVYNTTGGMKWLDQPRLDGFLLAASQINSDGGVLGRRLEVVEVDGTTDTTVLTAPWRSWSTASAP